MKRFILYTMSKQVLYGGIFLNTERSNISKASNMM